MTSTTRMILKLGSDNGWRQVRDKLLTLGCDEETARFAWDQINAKSHGQLDPRTRAKPTRDFLSLQNALNAEGVAATPGAQPELAVVWEHESRFGTGNVTVKFINI